MRGRLAGETTRTGPHWINTGGGIYRIELSHARSCLTLFVPLCACVRMPAPANRFTPCVFVLPPQARARAYRHFRLIATRPSGGVWVLSVSHLELYGELTRTAGSASEPAHAGRVSQDRPKWLTDLQDFHCVVAQLQRGDSGPAQSLPYSYARATGLASLRLPKSAWLALLESINAWCEHHKIAPCVDQIVADAQFRKMQQANHVRDIGFIIPALVDCVNL
jgi:hypothetical protein